MTRAEKVAEAQRLRREGLKIREIGERMGFAITTVNAWLSDPDRSKEIARKNSYRGTCEECGSSTNGSNGPGKAGRHCRNCAPDVHAKWSKPRIVAAIQQWAQRYGQPPTCTDWMPAIARHHGSPSAADKQARYEADDWPCTNEVRRRFGTWNAAIEAAGFEPMTSGQRRRAGAAA